MSQFSADAISPFHSLRRPARTRFALALLLSVGLVTAAVAAEIRTWTDDSGRNKLDASYVGLSEGQVKLKGKDGRTFEIPLDKLSVEDREYVTKLEDNPFKDVTPATSQPNANAPDNSAPFTSPVNPPNRKSFPPAGISTPTPAQQLADRLEQRRALRDRAPELVVDVDSAQDLTIVLQGEERYEPRVAGLDFKPTAGLLPPRIDVFERVQSFVVNWSARAAAVAYVHRDPRNTPQTRMFLLDLSSGRVRGKSRTFDSELGILALAGDGRTVVLSDATMIGEGTPDLRLLDLGVENSAPGPSWRPHHHELPSLAKVKWAAFDATNRLLTGTAKSGVGPREADLQAPRAIARAKTDSRSQPALSPDGRVLAVYREEMIQLFDLDSFKVVGQFTTPRQLSHAVLAFSPSGERLACAVNYELMVWNLVDGQIERQFPLIEVGTNKGVAFTAEGFVLVGERTLIDLENEIQVWSYTGIEGVATADGFTVAVGGSAQQATRLYALNLPHPGAVRVLEDVTTRPELVAFHPGVEVQLDVTAIPEEHREYVRKLLADKLEELNCPITENAPCTLIASVSDPVPREMTFEKSTIPFGPPLPIFGRGVKIGDYQFQERFSRIELKYRNDVIIERKQSNSPDFVTLKKGENVEGKLREAEAGINLKVFENFQLPRVALRPNGDRVRRAPTLGGSSIDKLQ